MVLSGLSDDELRNLSASTIVPPQAINQEILRRSQMRGVQGESPTLPAIANAETNPQLNPLLQGTALAQLPAPLPGQQPQAMSPLDKAMSAPWMGGGVPAFQLPAQPEAGAPDEGLPSWAQWLGDRAPVAAMDAHLPSVRPSSEGKTQLIQAMGAGAGERPEPYIADLGGLPPEVEEQLRREQAMQVGAYDKFLQTSGGKPPIDLNAVTPDYEKYVQQLRREMPDNTGELREAIAERKKSADNRSENALSQALTAAGLAMLSSRAPALEAFGTAGQQGLRQYNQQKDSAEELHARALAEQRGVEAMQQARNATISQGASMRGAEDVRAQQMQNRNNLDAWIAQNGAQMQRAQMQAMRAGAASNPMLRYAVDEYKTKMRMAEEMMLTDRDAALQLANRAQEDLNRVLSGRPMSGLPLMPDATPPAALMR